MQGRIRVIRGFVGQLCGERRYVREIWPPSEWKGGISFCLGTLRGGRQWFESSAIFKQVGQGDLSKKAQKVQEYTESWANNDISEMLNFDWKVMQCL